MATLPATDVAAVEGITVYELQKQENIAKIQRVLEQKFGCKEAAQQLVPLAKPQEVESLA